MYSYGSKLLYQPLANIHFFFEHNLIFSRAFSQIFPFYGVLLLNRQNDLCMILIRDQTAGKSAEEQRCAKPLTPNGSVKAWTRKASSKDR